MSASRSFASPSAHGMVHRVFRYPATQRPDATMAIAPRFPEHDIFVLGISDLPDRRQTIFVNPTDFSRGQSNLSVAFVSGHQRGSPTRTANHLRSPSRNQFQIVQRQANWNEFERQGISQLGWRARPALQPGPHFQPVRSDNILFFSIRILE